MENTNKYPMPLITEKQKQRAIEYCENSLVGMKKLVADNPEADWLESVKTTILVNEIALASLTAEKKGYDTCCEPWYEYAYTAPPVPTLKLPQDLYEHESGLVGHYPTLSLQTPSWAEGYREAILDVKLLNEVQE